MPKARPLRRATIENLLKPDPRIAERMDAIIPVARAAGLPFRMAEGNSCYRGGKPGMSNALAAALWGGNYISIWPRKVKGINFHGGLGKQIAAGLGDKLPGAQSAAIGSGPPRHLLLALRGKSRRGDWARPIFYGTMLVEQFAGTTLVANEFDAAGANATAYTAKAADGYRIAVFNKDAIRDLDVHVDLAGLSARPAKTWRLTGPALDATKGITLAGAEVAHGSAQWRPLKTRCSRPACFARIQSASRQRGSSVRGELSLPTDLRRRPEPS